MRSSPTGDECRADQRLPQTSDQPDLDLVPYPPHGSVTLHRPLLDISGVAQTPTLTGVMNSEHGTRGFLP